MPMKDSGVEWLGEVPAHWEVQSFTRAFSVVYRYPTYFDVSYVDDGVKEIRGEAIDSSGRLIPLSDMRYISQGTSDRFPMTILELDDLVMTVRGTLGKVAIVSSQFEGANITANLLRLSPDRNHHDPLFLLWYMLSPAFRDQLDYVSSQTTIKTVTVPQLSRIAIAKPPMREQHQIVSWLAGNIASIDDLSSDAINAISLLQERRSALISAAVTGKIDVRGLAPDTEQAA